MPTSHGHDAECHGQHIFLTGEGKWVKHWLTEIAKECRMSYFLFGGLGWVVGFFFRQMRYCTVRPTAAGVYAPESIPQTIPCVCLVSGYFYRTMQQWGFQKQALVDLPQALFIPARSFSRSCRLSNAWHSSEETALGTGTNYLGI